MVTAGLSLHGLAFSFIYGPAIKAAQVYKYLSNNNCQAEVQIQCLNSYVSRVWTLADSIINITTHSNSRFNLKAVFSTKIEH